jgi:hypothetical protein
MKERMTRPGTKHTGGHASAGLPCSEEVQVLHDLVYGPEAFHVNIEVYAAEPLYDLVSGDIRLLRIRGRLIEECSIVQPREVGLSPRPKLPVWMVEHPAFPEPAGRTWGEVRAPARRGGIFGESGIHPWCALGPLSQALGSTSVARSSSPSISNSGKVRLPVRRGHGA